MPVALVLERSIDLAVAVLAIAKAGGAYLPVDPGYPEERVRSMLEQSRAPLALTTTALVERLPPALETEVLCLDRARDELAQQSSEDPVRIGEPEHLAYVLFTSGSTGRPKGVAMPHGPLVNLVRWQLGAWTPPGPAKTLQFTSLSFDVASQEIWSTWSAGGELVVIDELTRRNSDALLAMIIDLGVERLFLPFVALQQLADAVDRRGGAPTRLRDVAAAGEALQITPAIRRLFTRLDGCALHNHYGPTESHVVTALTLEGPAGEWPELPTIGRPITSARIYLVGGDNGPVPTGELGEIFIGGPVLSRGYLNQPKLTNERFLPDPFADERDARMYRTGDLGRMRPDGTIEYLGRADTQVKISGYRVELGEVEATLSRHPAVTGAVASAYSARPGETMLIGYVTQGNGRVSGEVLRQFVAEHLPSFMVPARILTLEVFPQTPSGKIDRGALPEPSGERDVDSATVAPPRTRLERDLVRIWEEELEIHPIGLTDDFFDLGATSFVAARLFARIERDLGAKLPLGPIYQAPTIERLARLIQEGADEQRWTSLVPMQTRGTKPPIFCVHGGAGTILHLQPLVRRLGDDQPFYGLQARGLYGGVTPLLTVEEMAEHYLSELRTVQPHGPYYLAGYCFGAIVAFDMAQRLLRAGERVATLVMFNAPSPTWRRTYGTIWGQPSRTAQFAARKKARRPLHRRVIGVLTNREKIAHYSHHYLWRAKRKVGRLQFSLCMRFQWPLPEHVREEVFLHINSQADCRYVETFYPGEIVMFYGGDLYDDPSIGWSEFAADMVCHAVPGEHALGNRDSMAEPKVRFVAERLHDYLATVRAEAPKQATPPSPRRPRSTGTEPAARSRRAATRWDSETESLPSGPRPSWRD